MKKIITFLCFSCIAISLCSQPVLLKKISKPGIIGLHADPLGNFYLNTPTEIFKYNQFDTLFSRYSELQNGAITSIDVSNPMKIVVFYATFSKVVFLDNTLNTTFVSTDLYSLGLETATAVCTSYDNGFWVYDAPTFSLTRINSFGEPDRTVKNINQLTGTEIRPSFMLEKENTLYLYDDRIGVFVFDIFGGFLKKIPLVGIDRFSVVDKNLYFLRENRFIKLDTRIYQESTSSLPVENVKNAIVEKDKLYILTHSGEIYVYRLP